MKEDYNSILKRRKNEMEVTIGKEGLSKSWQDEFPEETKCCGCEGVARIGFVAHEGIDLKTPEDSEPAKPREQVVADLYLNGGKGVYWLHDYCAVAVYFCRDCLEPTALYNQA